MEPSDSATTSPKVSRLPLIAMGAVVALAVLVAIGLGLRGTESYPPGSPEAALQSFLQAGLDGDADAAIALVLPSDRADCRDELDEPDAAWPSSGIGFELDEMRVDGDTARAEVTMRRSDDGDPFGGSSRSSPFRFELEAIDGEWFVADASWPWWIDRCLSRP